MIVFESFLSALAGRLFGGPTPFAISPLLPFRGIPFCRWARRHLAVSAYISAWLCSGSCLLSPLTGRAETASFSSAPAHSPLGQGEWNGVVVFEHGPTRFALHVNALLDGDTSVQIDCDTRTRYLKGVSNGHDRLTLTIDPATGERLEGSVVGDSFVGYYRADSSGAAGAERSFPFRATRVAFAEKSGSRGGDDLGGEWIFTLRSADGVTRTATALVAHGREKIYALWREADGTRRSFIGFGSATRFALEEVSHGTDLVLGRSQPGDGTVSGELVEASGRTSFTAQRKDARPIINLAGVN